jgi:hypothetical protein
LRRSYFGNHAVSVGNKHRFAACGKANVFAEPVLEHFETDRSHFETVATRSYICQRDENGGGPGVRLRKPPQGKQRK